MRSFHWCYWQKLSFCSNLNSFFTVCNPSYLYLTKKAQNIWICNHLVSLSKYIRKNKQHISQTLGQLQNQAPASHRHRESPSWTCYEGERSEILTPSDVTVFLLDQLGTATLTNAPGVVKSWLRKAVFVIVHLCVWSLTSEVTLRRTQTECIAWTVS